MAQLGLKEYLIQVEYRDEYSSAKDFIRQIFRLLEQTISKHLAAA